MTLRQILKRLNFGPWFPRCGRRPWSPSTVHHILADPVYTGTAYANRVSIRCGPPCEMAGGEVDHGPAAGLAAASRLASVWQAAWHSSGSS